MGSDEYISRSLMGGVAPSRGGAAQKKSVGPAAPVRKGAFRHGKRVVYVTPFRNSAKEEAEKYAKKGVRVEIKKEPDDTGKMVFVVYVFE
jgi:hypothetical protein